jgi:L-2-hydroxycarboxylate dehydrogenase (NAD+)
MFNEEALRDLTKKILISFGYPEGPAGTTATTLVEADAKGVSSHGVTRLAIYEGQLKDDYAKPTSEPKVVFETPISLVIDGHHGIGSYISDFAVNKCLEKTALSGVCYTTVRNSNHYGMVGLWAERAAKHGYIGISMTNTIR